MIDLSKLTSNSGVFSAISNPQFENAGRVHDWRNYVPALLQEHWNELSVDSRLIVYAMAEDRASAEEWD